MARKTPLLALLLLPILLLATACSGGNYTSIMSVGNNTSTQMSMSYELLDGNRTKTFHLNEGETAEAIVDIVTDEGTLGLSIVDKDGISYYQGTELPTSNFNVKLEKAGDYTVNLDAVKHKGSFSIEWIARES